MLKHLLVAARPRQWVKNLVVFAALVFSGNAVDSGALITTVFAFLIFCLLSSVMYLVNDLVDVERDSRHPIKRLRPIAGFRHDRDLAVLLEEFADALADHRVIVSQEDAYLFGGHAATYFSTNCRPLASQASMPPVTS